MRFLLLRLGVSLSSPNIALVIVMRDRIGAAGKTQKIFWLKTY
jgi:hypothetical protein